MLEVAYSPDRRHAIVFLEYNPASTAELYLVLCERSGGGWISLTGSSGGGVSWNPTDERAGLGVITRWDPPRAEWNAPPPGELSARTPERRA